MKNSFIKSTAKIRHLLVKLLAPTMYEYSYPPPDYRPMIKFMQQHFADTPLIGVEIGGHKGENALTILKSLNIKKLYLIDPYGPFLNTRGQVLNTEQFYRICVNNMEPYGKKVRIIRKKSEEAVNDIPDNLDFVYIDGDHHYEFVKKDIELYYPKVKTDGVLGGHDFSAIEKHQGIFNAVVEFVVDQKLKLFARAVGVRRSTDWWVLKE